MLALAGAPASVKGGFTTRQGGCSQSRFASLNLDMRPAAPGAGDDETDHLELVHANLALFRATLELGRTPLTLAEQVHGVGVGEVMPNSQRVLPGADAIVAGTGSFVGVLTADCVPMLLMDLSVGERSWRRVAAVHAGWKGLLGGLIGNTLKAMAASGARSADLGAIIGPAIGPCCYLVGEERAAAFAQRAGAAVTTLGEARARQPGELASGARAPLPKGSSGQGLSLDLVASARAGLIAGGVREANIIDSGLCTSCERELFFSFRRDGGVTGRQLAYLANG